MRIYSLVMILALAMMIPDPAFAGGLKKQQKQETAALLKVPKKFQKLNLTDEQKSQIHQMIQDLKPQIKTIHQKLRAEMMGVLTDSQKAQLQKHARKAKPT